MKNRILFLLIIFTPLACSHKNIPQSKQCYPSPSEQFRNLLIMYSKENNQMKSYEYEEKMAVMGGYDYNVVGGLQYIHIRRNKCMRNAIQKYLTKEDNPIILNAIKHNPNLSIRKRSVEFLVWINGNESLRVLDELKDNPNYEEIRKDAYQTMKYISESNAK